MTHKFIKLGLFAFVIATLWSCATPQKMMKDALKANDIPRLKQLAEESLKKNPNDPFAIAMMGKVFLALGKPDSAIVYLKNACNLDPKNQNYRHALHNARIVMGDTLMKRDLAFRAAQQYEMVAEKDSTNFEAWRKLGFAQRTLGNYDSASLSYQHALRLNPDADSLQKVLDFFDAAHVQSNLLMKKGQDYLRKKQYKQAMIALEKALKAKPDNKEARYYFHMASGMYYFKRGSLKKLWDAIDHFGKASTLRPEAPEPHFYMAEAYLKKDDKDFENTIREYQEAIRLAPESKIARKAKKRIREIKKRERLYRNFWKKG